MRKASDQITTPFYTSLKETSEAIHHRYFFPGHIGGRFLPNPILSDPTLDLPELDFIDSVHSPAVRLPSNALTTVHYNLN